MLFNSVPLHPTCKKCNPLSRKLEAMHCFFDNCGNRVEGSYQGERPYCTYHLGFVKGQRYQMKKMGGKGQKTPSPSKTLKNQALYMAYTNTPSAITVVASSPKEAKKIFISQMKSGELREFTTYREASYDLDPNRPNDYPSKADVRNMEFVEIGPAVHIVTREDFTEFEDREIY